MKKSFYLFSSVLLALSLLLFSCKEPAVEVDEYAESDPGSVRYLNNATDEEILALDSTPYIRKGEGSGAIGHWDFYFDCESDLYAYSTGSVSLYEDNGKIRTSRYQNFIGYSCPDCVGTVTFFEDTGDGWLYYNKNRTSYSYDTTDRQKRYYRYKVSPKYLYLECYKTED